MLLTFRPMPHDGRGAPVTSAYFETFYLPLFGPQAVVTSRHLARQLANVDIYEVDDRHLGQLLGLPGMRERSIPSIHVALDRLHKLHMLAGKTHGDTWLVRTHVDPLKPRQIDRLPFELQVRHKQLMDVSNGK